MKTPSFARALILVAALALQVNSIHFNSHAAALMLRLAMSGTLREKATSLKMQRIVRGMKNPQAFIQAPETQPYRNEQEIRSLFVRLSILVRKLRMLTTCWIAEV